MKNTELTENEQKMLPEYPFNYTKAKPNRFATPKSAETSIVVTLDPDIAKVFTTSEAVNRALRAILSALPQSSN